MRIQIEKRRSPGFDGGHERFPPERLWLGVLSHSHGRERSCWDMISGGTRTGRWWWRSSSREDHLLLEFPPFPMSTPEDRHHRLELCQPLTRTEVYPCISAFLPFRIPIFRLWRTIRIEPLELRLVVAPLVSLLPVDAYEVRGRHAMPFGMQRGHFTRYHRFRSRFEAGTVAR